MINTQPYSLIALRENKHLTIFILKGVKKQWWGSTMSRETVDEIISNNLLIHMQS